MDAWGQLLAVSAVLGLLAAALLWLRRAGPGVWRARAANGRRLEIVERLPLTPQHSLHLVRLCGRDMLIATTPSGCSLLDSGEKERP